MNPSDFSQSQEYKSFRSSIPLRRIVVDSNAKAWKVYDSGPKTVKTPLVCLPPVSGTADVFFRQILALSAKGLRVIAVEHPVYWSVSEWCAGFKKLMDHLSLDKVHFFGASLGGFLAQKFAELNVTTPRVASLILCNTFMDTNVFNYSDSAALFWMLPSLVLKKMIMGNFTSSKVDVNIADSIDFMVERLESLTQQDLASRLTLNCVSCYVQPDGVKDLPVTIIDVFDEYALSGPVREELYKCYPNARLAHLKSGGNFPYLSRSDQVNVYIQIHLRDFRGTEESPWYEVKSNPVAGPKAEPMAEHSTESEGDSNSVRGSELKAESGTKLLTVLESAPEAHSGTESETQTRAESQTESRTESRTESQTESQAETQAESQAESRPESRPESQAQPETVSELTPKVESGTEPMTESGTGSDAELSSKVDQLSGGSESTSEMPLSKRDQTDTISS